jgi:DNA-binding NarL/FixJ family response regulator
MKKILVVDDHPLLREGVASVLEAEGDLEVCGKAGSAEEALELVKNTKPDLILTDLTLPGKSGLELIKDLKVLHSHIPVLAMSMHDEMIYAERVLKSGGRGYIMKESASDSVVDAIRKVLDGGIFVSRAVTDHFLNTMSSGVKGSKASFPIERLTDRELEIFELIGLGKSSQCIADQMHISPRTVDAHRAHIREKFGFADSTELTRYAVRWTESGSIGQDA